MGFLRIALPLLFGAASLDAAADCLPTSIAPATPLADATVGVPYDQTFTASGSAALPYGYQVTSGLPSGFGLAMNASTGELTGTPLLAGEYVMTVTATDTDGCNGGRSYALAVAVGDQTITFDSTAPADASVGGPTYTVMASATSGLSVVFAIDPTAASVCSITGSTVSFLSVGTCVIVANQAGDSNWHAAPQVQQSFSVGKGDQTITFTSTAPSGAQVGGPTYDVAATASSGLAVTFTIDASATSVCSIAGNTVSFTAGGTCVIDANQSGDANWNAAMQAQQSFTVAKLEQTISFTSSAPANAQVGGATYSVAATSTSGLTVTFSAGSAGCTVAGSTVTFVHASTCTINADQAGNAQYSAAPQAQQSFAVAKGDQTLSFSSTAPAYGSATAAAAPHTYTATATATSGLAPTFSTSGACSNAGGLITFGPSAGNCTINADQAGDSDWNAAAQVQQSVTVEIPASADDDSETATGNVAINVAAGNANNVLSGDTGTAIAIRSFGVNGNEQTTLGSATATAQGGSVALNSDGSYAYDPPANFTGSDTFKYVIGNDLTATSTGTVTLTVSDRIMVVATSGVGAADCRPQSACTLATADAKAAVTAGKDVVFVASGSYSLAAFSLLANQNIAGQQVALSTALADAGITLAADSVTAPITALGASTAPSLSNSNNVITLGGGNLVEYFSITNSAGSAILGNAAGSGTSNIHDIAVTDGAAAGNGITLTANLGTVNFSNLVVTTSTGNAFAATGGGTVNVTTGTVPNVLTAATGTALNVSNTTIGASGLHFQSISAGTVASGPINGIVLIAAGSGGLTVTGAGGACNAVGGSGCSGGTIQNTTGAAIALTNTGNISLTRMFLKDAASHGIDMSGGSNLTLASCVLQSNGDGDNEHDLRLVNVGGTLSLSGGLLYGAAEDLLNVDNTATNLAATISAVAFEYPNPKDTTFSNSAVLFSPKGSSDITLTITGSSFKNIPVNSLNFGGNATSTAVHDVTFSNNTVSVDAALNVSCSVNLECRAGGVTVSSIGTDQVNFVATGNTFTRASGSGVIEVGANTTSFMQARVENNNISNSLGDGISLGNNSRSHTVALFNNNTLSNIGGDGFQMLSGEVDPSIGAGSEGDLDLTLTNNTVATHTTNSAIQFVGGFGIFNFGDADQVLCLHMTGNAVSGTPPGFFDIFLEGSQGGFSPPNQGFIRYQAAGSGTLTPAIVNGDNPSTTLANIYTNSGVLSNGAACAVPSI